MVRVNVRMGYCTAPVSVLSREKPHTAYRFRSLKKGRKSPEKVGNLEVLRTVHMLAYRKLLLVCWQGATSLTLGTLLNRGA
jgi:hypothetical protein